MKYEEYFEHHEELMITFRGVSMQPMLDSQQDVVVIQRKGAARLKKDDVALFRYRGKYVLHRVITVGPDRYDFLGDNCITPERGVMENDVLGILTAYEHHGVHHTTDDPEYLAYVRRINRTRTARVFLKRLKSYAGKLKRRLLSLMKSKAEHQG